MSKSDTTGCRYHQRSPAKWHCTQCDLVLCSDCKPLADQQPDDVPCPLCDATMADVDAGPPFWHHWRDLLRYPLERTSLVLIVTLAVVQLATPSGLPTVLASLPLLAAYLYFAFSVFDRSACGIDQPPTFAALFKRERADTRLEAVLIGLAFAGVICAGALTGWPMVAWAVVLLAFLVLPASIMAFAVDERLQSAFDIQRLTSIIKRLGPGYGHLAAASLTAAVAPTLLLMLPSLILPNFIHVALLTLLYAWAGLVLARSIGSFLFRHRRELAFAAGVDPIDRSRPPAPGVYQPLKALADARVQAADGRLDQARLTIGEALTQYPRNGELNRRFEELLAASGKSNELKNHIERVLSRKVTDGDAAGAVEHWLRHREALGQWLPRISATRHHMALELESRGDYRTAVRLLLSLPKNDPRYRKLPEACLEAARMLEEHFDDRSSAEPLRKFVVKRFPARAATWFERHQMPQTG